MSLRKPGSAPTASTNSARSLRPFPKRPGFPAYLCSEFEIGAAGDFSACETVEAVVDELLRFSLNPSYEIATERDRQELIDMTERHFAEMQE